MFVTFCSITKTSRPGMFAPARPAKPDWRGYRPVIKALCRMSEKQGYHSKEPPALLSKTAVCKKLDRCGVMR
jgi:hypothetical protein